MTCTAAITRWPDRGHTNVQTGDSRRGLFPSRGKRSVWFLSANATNVTTQATKHSFGAEQYWEWARIFSRLAHTDIDNGLSDLIVPFLDIGKEGELQGQLKSIVRDLEIMLRIQTEQREVVEKFEKTIPQIARGGKKPDLEPLLMEIQSNIEDLEDMRRSADDISASVSKTRNCSQEFERKR